MSTRVWASASSPIRISTSSVKRKTGVFAVARITPSTSSRATSVQPQRDSTSARASRQTRSKGTP